MPLPPFHIGPMLLIYALLPFLDPIGLLLGAVAPDVEAGAYYYFGVGNQLHGPLHSLLGGGIATVGTFVFTRLVWRIYSKSELPLPFKMQVPSRKLTLIASLLGCYSHIFLDAPLYRDMNLLWPLPYSNPLLGRVSSSAVHVFCVICFLMGFLLVVVKKHRERD